MSLSNVSLTKDDFLQSQWENVITECEKKCCEEYYLKFRDKLRQLELLGNTDAQKVFYILEVITFPVISPEIKSKENTRSEVYPFFMGAINTLNEQQLNVLKELQPEISDPEMRARVADILLIREKELTKKINHTMAESAVDSYLKSAEYLEDIEHWTPAFARIQRALHIAVLLGKNNQPFKKAIKYIENLVDTYNCEDPSLLSVKLMELLQVYRREIDSSKYAELAKKAAISAGRMKDWERARIYWEIKVKWHEVGSNERQAAQRCAAETYVKESKTALKRPLPYTFASVYLKKAIEELRKAGGAQKRVENLRKTLLGYQQNSLAEMITISTKIDISQSVEQAIEKMRGKQLYEALFTLALIDCPKYAELRTQVEAGIEKDILSRFFSESELNEMGKATVITQPLPSNNPEEVDEATIETRMFNLAKYYQKLLAEAFVKPSIEQINSEHNVAIEDFLPILCNNPFVPPGREYIYARGLQSGIKRDFLVAAHLLIPQLENSVRHILSQ